MKILIENVRVLDPKTDTDEITGVYLEDGEVRLIGDYEEDGSSLDRRIDGTGLWLTPGLIDPHVHLREPGFEHKETLETGSKSAAAGGFTTIACMPNTNPVLDHSKIISELREKAEKQGIVEILPIGSITLAQKGEELADFQEYKKAGVVGVSEDGKSVLNAKMMKKAMTEAEKAQMPVLVHCEDLDLVDGGAMHEGPLSRKLGIKGIPSSAEDVITARDLILGEETEARVHLCHMSTKGSVELLRNAKKKGLKASGEVSPHHLTLTVDEVDGVDTNTKMNPPLREKEDREALIEALIDGTIDMIATDHAPHTQQEKDTSYEKAPFGIVGLETAVGVVLTELYHGRKMTPLNLIGKMTSNPAKLLNLHKGNIEVGKIADLVLIDPEKEWSVKPEEFRSKSANTPFKGKKLKGRVIMTIRNGKIIMEKGKILKEFKGGIKDD